MSKLKFFLKGLLLVAPVLALMVYVNYMVDPSGLFHGKQFEREAVDLLLQGYPISNYDSLDSYTRSINEALIMNSAAYDTIVIGSSRCMQINAEMVHETGRFLNMGVIAGDYQDLFGTFYICVRENKLPKRVILSLDPWMLNINEVDSRSNRDLYLEFVKGELGFQEDYQMPDPAAKWEALIDPAYFQGALAYQKRDTSGEAKPEAVTENLYDQSTTVKMPDGTILYDKAFREQSQAQIDSNIFAVANSPSVGFRITGYTAPSDILCAQLEAYVDYMQKRGIEVVFYLPPYPNGIYDSLVRQKETYPGVFATEDYLRALAKEKGITLYGSYDPARLGLSQTDFYDHLHLRAESTAKVFALGNLAG